MWLYPIGPFAKRRIEAGQVHLAPGASRKAPGKDTDTADDVASGHAANVEEGSDDKAAAKAEEGQGNNEEEETEGASPTATKEVEPKVVEEEDKADARPSLTARPSFTASFRRLSQSFADNTYNQDLQSQSMTENAKAKEIWENAELYDEDAEMLFTYLQVFTACLNSFAHGG